MENLQNRLKSGEIIELTSEHDSGEIFFRKSLGGQEQFFFKLNAKIVIMVTRFKTFNRKLDEIIERRKLKLNCPIEFDAGMSTGWKFGIVTRTVEKLSDDEFVIHDTSDGWTSAHINLDTLVQLVAGTKSLTEINFE